MQKIKNKPFVINLQLFAEGGSGDGGTASGTSVTGTNAESNTGDNNTAQIANEQKADVAPSIDRNAEFEKLIKGDYKDLYDAKVQDTVRKRLKNNSEIVNKYNALTPAIELLAHKYDVDANDITALAKAIEEDDSYIEDEALELGVSTQTLRKIKSMERENAELKRQRMEADNQKAMQQTYANWMGQAEEAKKTYPNLDMHVEAKNPEFLKLLNAGIDVKTAFEVIHKNEIFPAVMQYTAKQVEQKIANKIQANGNRPSENGLSNHSSASVKSDVSQLSKKEFAEYMQRISRGEKISFG